METLRPDEDDLRERQRPAPDAPAPKKPKRPVPAEREVPVASATAECGRGAGVGVMLLVLVLAAGGGWWLFEQQREIARLNAWLAEADDALRQSRLALARFEGQLNETGDDLVQREQTVAQRLEAQGKRLDTADSEIRKLWGVAYDRNRTAIAEQGKQLQAQQSRLDELAGQVTNSATASTALAQQVTALDERIKGMGEASQQLAQRVQQSEQATRELMPELERRVTRAVSEQSLALQGLEGRVTELNRRLGDRQGDSELADAKARIAELELSVRSIDTARGQIMARLAQLSEQLDDLARQR